MSCKSLSMMFQAGLSAIVLLGASFNAAQSAELIMMEQDACLWCERWHEEIGAVYNRTAEGEIAPLRIVNIHSALPQDLKHLRMARFTPTFVLLSDGQEVDRLRGYTGDEFFWFLLGEMLKKLPEGKTR